MGGKGWDERFVGWMVFLWPRFVYLPQRHREPQRSLASRTYSIGMFKWE